MNNMLLFLFALTPTFLFAQAVKKITDNKNHETFFVLKSDKKINHGEYKKFTAFNKLLIKGYYKQGVKDSIWECYDFNGHLTLKYDYTKAAVVSYTPNDYVKARKYRFINGCIKVDTTLDRPPIFLGGDSYIMDVVMTNLRYPESAFSHKESGTVHVSFTVDKFGKTSNFHVDQPIGAGLDEEAIRVLKLLPDNWLPGLLNGQSVDVEVVYPVGFNVVGI